MEQEQPSRVGRRLAAIVAADVAGYSRLMGLDEAGTARTLREHRSATDALVAKYGGRIVKTTGDGLLLEFPSVVDAVECAVAVQTVLAERNEGIPQDRRMLLRIGINLGDILIEGDDILGDGVNIAARLEGIAEPGGICISASAYDQVRGKVVVEFADLGELSLKNIARPVRAYAVVGNAVGERTKAGRGEFAPSTTKEPRSILLDPTKPPLPPNKPSIAVLPFQNMSGDLEQEYFADGMVEDIITALSRFRSLFVIARNSSFAYKGKAVNIKRVGNELGVRYVLEGSVRKAGSFVRITGQLIEAATGAHLWADKFDGSLENVFELQDNVARSVVGAIVPQLILADADQVVRKPPKSWDSYDHYLRGLSLTYRGTLEGNRLAQIEFETAISLDANFALAYVHAAFQVHNRFWNYLAPFTEQERAEAIRLTLHALELAPKHDGVLSIAAYILGNMNREVEHAIALADQSLDLNPNVARAWAIKGYLSALAGDLSKAHTASDQAIRLNPLDIHNVIGALRGHLAASFVAGAPDELLAWAKKLVALYPADVHALFALREVALVNGDASEADRILGRIVELYPQLRKPFLREMYLRYRKPEHQAMIEAVIERSGVPD